MKSTESGVLSLMHVVKILFHEFLLISGVFWQSFVFLDFQLTLAFTSNFSGGLLLMYIPQVSTCLTI